jgi:UDP-N-acetylglucosamine:LPS N-acetylglucosamine transferase
MFKSFASPGTHDNRAGYRNSPLRSGHVAEGRPAPRVLAVASSGGHWVQLMRLRPAWQGCDVAYLTTDASYLAPLRAQANRDGVLPPRLYTTVAANRWQKLRLLRQLASIAWVVVRERPAVVCTTGAAPGYFAIRIAGLLGARTVWIDSIANAESLSMAGRLAGRCADVWLTQWESLAAGGAGDGRRPASWGAVL